MAKQVTVTLVDDYDGESEAAETVDFQLDGTQYEIDLSPNNAEAMRAALAPWIKKARRTAGRRHVRRPASGHAQDNDAIREWAHRNGHQIATRGRISQSVRDAYAESKGNVEPEQASEPAPEKTVKPARAPRARKAQAKEPALVD